METALSHTIMPNFHAIIDRSGTHSLKWEKYAGEDILPMWVADMDFTSPECVVKALRDRVDHGVFGYTMPPDELVALVRTRFRERYSWPIEPEWLVWLPGVVPGLSAACTAYTEAGDDIATFTPVYPPFLQLPGKCGRTVNRIPLLERDGHYTIDPELFERSLTSRTRLLLLCQPHNPIGRVFTDSELRPVLQICRKRNIIVCSDEIHCDLILDDRPHRPVASMNSDTPNFTVTLMSPGKTFNTAGLNMGFAVIPDKTLRHRYLRTSHFTMPHPNALGYTAALAAYRDGGPWRQELLDVLKANAARTHTEINALPTLSMHAPEATYLAWIDARSLGEEDPYEFFKAHGIALSDGRQFDAAGFVRLNFGCPPATLRNGLARIRTALGCSPSDS